MSHQPEPNPNDATARAVRQHLENARAAGVEWLPRESPLPASSRPSADAGPSLFAEVEAAEPVPEADLRRRELTVLAERVAGCTRCPELAVARTRTVFGVGPIDADLCFLGEAPGADEDRQGVPFVGAAGHLLDKIIAACGMKREEVFICNILRCRPPGNRPPKPPESANCREWLDGTLDLVRPKFICCLGATAAQNLLGTRTPIGRMRGKFYEYRGIPVLCTYHPASLLPSRSPEKKKDVWEDMKLLLQRMGKPIPKPGGK
jgi:DNA polymerase